MHFLCKVSPTVKVPKFPRTTALQRYKLFVTPRDCAATGGGALPTYFRFTELHFLSLFIRAAKGRNRKFPSVAAQVLENRF